ncbi:hypothetical protein RRG08_023996 [Elysia crispata]|uniref:G-protein coupled receptors family 1 profile domain-containing protein n=1 Tax=Elysia crispata TaxID=231223 RepID=A0AAE0YMI1_9GAST|nr:hypothetical protein RRG08_023996 [Elysia crispata]
MNVSSALSTTSDLALSNLLDLRLSNCFLTDLLVPFKKFDRLSKLDVSYDLFRNITHNGSDIRAIYSGGHSLRLLHLSFNALLTLIEVDTLSNNLNLRVLDLSLTALATFSNTSRIIHDLMHLNLSYTRIKFIGDFIIPIDHKAWHLEIIDLRGVEIDKVRCFVFTGLIIAICRATISKLATFETSSTEHEWCETHKFSITDNAATCSHDLSLKMERDLCVARNLAPITFTNLLCWLIVGAMRLVSLGDDSLGGELTSWATVFVLPINAALNPVFYSLPVIRNYLQNNSRTYGS